MSDTQHHGPTLEAPPKHERFLWFKHFAGWKRKPDGMPPFIWAERSNAQIIALAVLIGVPALGFSHIDWYVKWIIAAVWFAVSHPFFVHFERREIIGQMQGRGSLDATQASKQQSTAQLPYWGAFIAFVIWLIVFAIFVTSKLSTVGGMGIWQLANFFYQCWWDTPVYYGIVEWMILIHTWKVTNMSNDMTYNEIGQFNQATPRALRGERRVPPG